MQDIDVLIIGAGVVGLSVAREVSKSFREVVVVEKNDYFGRETSSRNSEVIHAGMYYPSGTLKAKLCVEGRRLLYELCRKENIPHKKTGKLIVAAEKEEIKDLDKLYASGIANGVEGLRLINKQELKSMEPEINGIAALYSPETGIIDSHRLMQYFYNAAKANGAVIAFNAEVKAIKSTGGRYKITVNNDSEIADLKSGIVVNCAGLDSDEVAEMAGIDIKKDKYSLHYCKGQYFRVDNKKASLIERLIYPVPKPKSGGLGIHATLDLAGGMRLGPDDKYLGNRSKDYSVDNSRLLDFYSSASKLMPFLEESDLYPDTSGIRPKLQEPGGEFRDFIIQNEAEKGLGGLINLVGIESPGLTASVAIANRVKDMLTSGLIGERSK